MSETPTIDAIVNGLRRDGHIEEASKFQWWLDFCRSDDSYTTEAELDRWVRGLLDYLASHQMPDGGPHNRSGCEACIRVDSRIAERHRA